MDIPSRRNELELLALKPSEKKIILTISKMGKSLAEISRATDIPHSSLRYMIKILQKKSYVWPVTIGRRKVWRSNIPKIVQYIKNIQK